ncbi:MAG: DUF1080 domain-containing protein [Planctomycetales bacterium]|nr:DUF1080 domain-containing protein [Planctomycetales bacterium]
MLRALFLSSLASALLGIAPSVVFAAGPTYTDPAKADADFAYQGEYSGTLTSDGNEVKVGVQIIALGKGKFHGIGFHGGLPGEGGDKEKKVEGDGELKDGVLVIKGPDGGYAKVAKEVATLYSMDDKEVGKLKKIARANPYLGAKPPEGAVILFDGNTNGFEGGKVEDGLLAPAVTSKQKFGSHKLHIEFRIPYQPEDRGQGRGNSGIYLQGRYEVQMLDSFGLEGKDNECGGIYSVKAPDVNMCLPPLAWQTYDIEYTAAKYEGDKVVSKPKVTVLHNGVVIHKDVELPSDRNTTAAPVKAGPEAGPIYLQDHGNPVRYRNIWVVETK